MSNHTPGPWSVEPRFSLRVGAAGGVTVASAGSDSGIRDQWEANARLIAAAPELLAMLQDAEAAIVHLKGETACQATLAGIRAAIAKATGAS